MANKKFVEKGKNDELVRLNESGDSYSFEWINLLVLFTLNPEKNLVEAISAKDEAEVKKHLTEESIKLCSAIQHELFLIRSKKEGQLLVGNYHGMLTAMVSQSYSNLKNLPKRNCSAYAILKTILKFLEEMISMIEHRFFTYMSMNELVPETYFRFAQKELSSRWRKIQSKISIDNPQKVPLEIIANKLNRFFNTNEFEFTTSYNNISYRKKLLEEIEKIDFSKTEFNDFTNLDKVLIYLNFNSVEYTNYLFSFIKRKVSAQQTLNNKIKELILIDKIFNQIQKRSDVIYNPKFLSIEALMNNWFEQELKYLEKLQILNNSLNENKPGLPKEKDNYNTKSKVVCLLSSDQIGLILRAAGDQKIIVSKSINEIFKTIVPNLSTPAKEYLSYDGMRSKSYVAESRDKQIAIDALEKIINRITAY